MHKFVLLFLFPAALWAQQQPLPSPHVLKDPDRVFRPYGPDAISDRGVGLLDKGELSNLIFNYGILSDFHLGTPALHWPREGEDVQHYGFGVNLILVADGQVISSIYDQSSGILDFGWEAADGSYGLYFNDTRTDYNTASDGLTPFLAFSDVRDTWPVIDGVPTWPGYWRENLESPGQFVEGEFVSDRDIFGVLQDDYGMGLTIKQTAYSYGRPYAYDLIMIHFRLINEGITDYNSCYIGFQADLKPDFYADDFIEYWEIDPYDQDPSFFYKWDYNGIAQRDDSSHFDELWIGPVGYIGMGMVVTPNDMGVTSFHYYHDDDSPNDPDEGPYFAAMLTNNPLAPLDSLFLYFHGADSTFDDPDSVGQVDKDALPGSEITFTFGSGPFYLAANDSVDFAVLFAIGEDSADLQASVDTAYFMARELSFQGSGPPKTPILSATAGDGQVRLVWDNEAESSIDAISGEADFEGYRLYKSTDGGLTWGDPITDFQGYRVGWVPLFQCDLIDSITGPDPAYGLNFPYANSWLGDDTGLSHTYLDEDVTNGLEVWYCVTSYDRGAYDPLDPSLTEPSYESPIGVSHFDVNVAVVIPGTQASNVTPGTTSPFVELSGQAAEGTLELIIVEESDLLDHTYQITFNETGDTVIVGEDTVVAEETTMNLEDLTAATFYFTDALTGDGSYFKNIPLSGDDLPLINGFRLNVEDVEGTGVSSLGWTTATGTTSTFDWWTENRHPGNPSSYEEVVEGLDDWRITITADTVPVPVIAGGFGYISDSTLWLPLRIERTDYAAGGIWIDATEYLQLSDLQVYPPFTGLPSLGPYGWDLIPGGAGFNPDLVFGTIWPDMLILRDDDNDTTGSTVWLKTQNGPADAIPPSVGDVYTIETYKPFHSGLIYEFSSQASTVAAAGSALSQIKVVPNPLIMSSGFETNPYESKVMFNHLPEQCEIGIYTVSGNRVVTLYYASDTGDGFTFWDLLNHQGQKVAYGVYVYVVKTPDGASHTGKLMVIR